MRVESWIVAGTISFSAACARDLPADGGVGGVTSGASGAGAGGSTSASGGSSSTGGTGVAGTGSGSSNPTDCVELPRVPAREPVLPFARACTLPIGSMDQPGTVDTNDARALVVGRWRSCNGPGTVVPGGYAGIEFGENGRYQMLALEDDALVPIVGAPRGIYYLLSSGQLELRQADGRGATTYFAYFDGTLGAMQTRDVTTANGPTAHYARVEPDPESAAQNSFSTSDGRCSLVGAWDTAPDSPNPPAAFLFDAEGEWVGANRGADLCDDQTMYGTYELTAKEFSIVTNVGAGRCDFWFGAGFRATFNDACDEVVLDTVWDNCTGGRGYLNVPGDVLIKRR